MMQCNNFQTLPKNMRNDRNQESVNNRSFCKYCNMNVFLKPKKQTVSVEEQGVHITFRRLFAVCMVCGHEIKIPEFEERNRKLINEKIKLVKQKEKHGGIS